MADLLIPLILHGEWYVKKDSPIYRTESYGFARDIDTVYFDGVVEMLDESVEGGFLALTKDVWYCRDPKIYKRDKSVSRKYNILVYVKLPQPVGYINGFFVDGMNVLIKKSSS